MNNLIKLINDEDGEPGDGLWHLVQQAGGGEDTILCTGEVYGYGEGDAVAELKTVKRGGIECRKCMRIIKEIKAVRL